MITRLLTLLLLPALAACGGDEPPLEVPPAAKLNREAVGYYCGMIVADHSGPKGQLFLKGHSSPLWFSSVRDTIAFTMLPEESKDIAAIYVHDMSQATSWDAPGDEAWMEAASAVYVIGSSRRGGMGAMEAVPFSDSEAATNFANENGGHVVSWDEIPLDYVLGGPEAEPPPTNDPSDSIKPENQHE